MEAQRSQVGAVKDALGSGRATTSTVAALQVLLGAEDLPKAQLVKTARPNGPVGKATSGRDGRVTNARSAKALAVAIHDDAPKPLSGREKYALATETVNICLKVLTDSLKTRQITPKESQAQVGSDNSNAPSTPSAPKVTPPSRALQPRSRNITPVRSPPKKVNGSLKRSRLSQDTEIAESSRNIAAIAECAHLGFSFLRQADVKALGIRELPKYQLETGMLALVGKLIGHGLYNMATKELRAVKRMLEISSTPQPSKKVTQAPRVVKTSTSAEKSVVDLLQLNADTDSDPAAIPVLITYYQHLLRMILASARPADIEAVAQTITLEAPNGPISLIIRQAKLSGDTAKAAKQLESFSQALLNLCPSVASAADDAATDRNSSPLPEAALKLQVLALQVRKLWWRLAKHKADVSKELLEPFLKCASAFVRRQGGNGSSVLDLLSASFERLGPFGAGINDHKLLSLYNLLSDQAEREGKHEQALHWAEEMCRSTVTFEPNHARRIAASVRKSALLISHDSARGAQEDLSALSELLQNTMVGISADHDLLLASLANFVHVLSMRQQSSKQDALPSGIKLLTLAASFAQRYTRSYPGKNVQQVQAVIRNVLRCAKSTEDLFAWITVDTANVFVQSGSVQTISKAAAKKPLLEAWQGSESVVMLGRILRALLLKTVRSNGDLGPGSVFDIEELQSSERGAILEWQLTYAAELASRPKYHAALKNIVSDLLKRLSKVYGANEYPLRRARVATILLSLREGHPELIPPHVSKVWHDNLAIDPTSLASDVGLERYCADIAARFAVVRMFSDGTPTVEVLKPKVLVWQQIVDCENYDALCNKLDDPMALSQLLRSIAGYFGMIGEDASALSIRRLLVEIERLNGADASAACHEIVDLGKQYLELGYSEKAGPILAQALSMIVSHPVSSVVRIHYHIVHAEYLLAVDKVDQCRAALEDARRIRSSLPPEQISRSDRRIYEQLHAQAWFIQSKYALETSSPHDALSAAKRSVRVLNGIWSSLGRATGTPKPEIDPDAGESTDTGVTGLTKGVSKLNLKPNDDLKIEQSNKGAAFWPVVPLLAKSLLHLSDMYAHHGLFNEASYYSERAVNIAESGGSTLLLSRMRSHQCRLLTLAGRTEEAELCLAQGDDTVVGVPSLALAVRICARAAVRAKEGSLQDAFELYEKAERVVDELSSESFLVRLERVGDDNAVRNDQATVLPMDDKQEASRKKTARSAQYSAKQPAKKGISKPNVTVAQKKSNDNANMSQAARPLYHSCYLLSKRKAEVLIDKALVMIRLGQDASETMTTIKQLPASLVGSLRQRHVQYQDLMCKARAAFQTDVTLNALTESTFSLPAIMQSNLNASKHDNLGTIVSVPALPTKRIAKSSAKLTKQASSASGEPEHILDTARECILKSHAASVQISSTSQTHVECSGLSNVSMLLSAIPESQANKSLHPLKEGHHVDLPRIKALQFEQKAVNIDAMKGEESGPLMWPADSEASVHKTFTAAEFQAEYIDIIPKLWTAVSLCLSDDESELYIARYRSGQSPFILKLPFSRHKPDSLDEEEEAFDYHKGKAELQQIVELSNYTCHNPGSLEAKGAKTKWWNEREALDRRLHELLINIENIWFGGFKAIFSHQQRHADLLSRFRKSFDQILDSYLPSRKGPKGRDEGLALDNKVLELFIGLGNDQEGTIDLEEPLADLLYFVVDIFQFNGERNAYDEIDFDSMAVDVLDALRSYHEAAFTTNESSQHLTLVLDRRLQAFPWESLPCLEGASVSRVGSMLSLRGRIMAMRACQNESSAGRLPNDGQGCHLVQRTAGTYILNPSSDLNGTQNTLEPALSRLSKTQSTAWNSIVNKVPSEEYFSSALTNSAITLYFGHGAGSQYIRPRTIKRLEQCSEVVWLMGCSSGAVSEYGGLEPSAIPLAYLLAGKADEVGFSVERREPARNDRCMAVVATLWDVTDKDIDRFSLTVGEEWGLWPASDNSQLPAKTPKKRQVIAAPSTPVQAPKTPKTPKVLKTPAPAKTPSRNRSRIREEVARKQSIVEAVARSRDACYLRYLNGAAPVVYGIPVYLGD